MIKDNKEHKKKSNKVDIYGSWLQTTILRLLIYDDKES